MPELKLPQSKETPRDIWYDLAKSTYLWTTVDYRTKFNKYQLKFPDLDKLVRKGHKGEGNGLWTITRLWLRGPPWIVNSLRWVLIDQLAGKTRGNSGSSKQERKNWMRMRNPFTCFFSLLKIYSKFYAKRSKSDQLSLKISFSYDASLHVRFNSNLD